MTRRGLELIAENGGAVAAWAGTSPTSVRTVYHGVCKVSIYVSAAQQGRGLGHRLLGDLVLSSESAGYWTLVAQIFPENEDSLSPHAASGFKIVSTRRKLGKMIHGPLVDRWHDVIMLERQGEVIR